MAAGTAQSDGSYLSSIIMHIRLHTVYSMWKLLTFRDINGNLRCCYRKHLKLFGQPCLTVPFTLEGARKENYILFLPSGDDSNVFSLGLAYQVSLFCISLE